VRSLEDLHGKPAPDLPYDIACGPGQCTERIRKLAGVERMRDLVDLFQDNFDALDNSRVVSLQKACDYFENPMPKRPVYTSPRVGLFLTKKNVPLEVLLFSHCLHATCSLLTHTRSKQTMPSARTGSFPLPPSCGKASTYSSPRYTSEGKI
jgi:hypothetical protein